MNYIITDENDMTLFVFGADREKIKKFEEKINISIEDINKQLKENGYFLYENKKCYLSKMFID